MPSCQWTVIWTFALNWSHMIIFLVCNLLWISPEMGGFIFFLVWCNHVSLAGRIHIGFVLFFLIWYDHLDLVGRIHIRPFFCGLTKHSVRDQPFRSCLILNNLGITLEVIGSHDLDGHLNLRFSDLSNGGVRNRGF